MVSSILISKICQEECFYGDFELLFFITEICFLLQLCNESISEHFASSVIINVLLSLFFICLNCPFFDLKILVLCKSDLANFIKKFSLCRGIRTVVSMTVCDTHHFTTRDGICKFYLQIVYGKYFHFVRQEPNYYFSLQIFVFGFIA